VKLDELIKMLEKILPKEEWKKFTLQTNVTINNWSNPVVIDRWIPAPYPIVYPNQPYPYTYPWVTYGGAGDISCGTGAGVNDSSFASASPHDVILTAGVFNIEG